MKNIKIKFSKGMALVEVIAALGISVVVITTLVSLSLYAMRASLQSKMLLQGTKVANREIELVRAYRDDSARTWDDFVTSISGCTASCYIDSSDMSIKNGTGVESQGTVEEMSRSFTATTPSGSQLVGGGASNQVVRISTTASWKIAGATKTTKLYTDLTNWRAVN